VRDGLRHAFDRLDGERKLQELRLVVLFCGSLDLLRPRGCQTAERSQAVRIAAQLDAGVEQGCGQRRPQAAAEM
jgi:hypothetical protein